MPAEHAVRSALQNDAERFFADSVVQNVSRYTGGIDEESCVIHIAGEGAAV